MLGTIIGDIVGSPYEHSSEPMKSKDFPWFTEQCRFTDDTVTTVAVAMAILEGKQAPGGYTEPLRRQLKYWCRKYPDVGFGSYFRAWFLRDADEPYGSYGNGAAMRVAPAAWAARSIAEAQELAELTAVVTHNHPEAIKGAVAVSSALYMARTGSDMQSIRAYIRAHFYPLREKLDEIRPSYLFTTHTAESVPQAIEAFLESDSFEDAVNGAVSLGGDTDTQGAMAGAMAEGMYGVSAGCWERAVGYLPQDIREAVKQFQRIYMNSILD